MNIYFPPDTWQLLAEFHEDTDEVFTLKPHTDPVTAYEMFLLCKACLYYDLDLDEGIVLES